MIKCLYHIRNIIDAFNVVYIVINNIQYSKFLDFSIDEML